MSESITFIDPDGTSTTVHDWPTVSDNAVLLGLSGIHSPPFELFGDEVPLEAGERITHVRASRRDVILPFRIYGSTETGLRTNVRTWVSRLNPLRGASTLRWAGPDATSRDLNCRLAGGTEGEISAATTGFGPWFQSMALIFRASDPWWYDVSSTVQSFEGTTATFFPFFPLSLSSSEVFGEVSVSNGGDTEAWPVITITGPGSGPVVRNITTSKLLDLTGTTLSAGESITVDTRPGAKTVLRQDGVSLFSSLTADSSLWRLERGANTVRVEMAATDANSAVSLSFKQRWLSV